MTAAAWLEVAAAFAAAIAGILLLVRGIAVGTGWLLVATALALPAWLVSDQAPAVLFTLSLVLTALPAVLAAAAGVVWPVSPLGRVLRATIVGALVSTALVGGLLPTLLFDPAGAGCNACPINLLEAYPAESAAAVLSRLSMDLTLVWGPAMALLAVRRWMRAPELARRHGWPQLGGAAGIAGLATVSAAHSLTLSVGEVDPLAEGIRLAQCALLVLITAGVGTRFYLVHTAGGRMARIVLAAIPDPPTVIASLRATLADPSLTVCFVRPDGTLIDGRGVAVAGAAHQAVLRLRRDQLTFAEIRYDQRLSGSADLVRASATSAGLAVEYLAAQARLRAELVELAAVRSRIVAAGDAERQRLERNLHDGAQQRLIALGLMAAVRAEPATFSAVHTELDAALDELRTVARGLFPTSLQEAGVGAALRELGDHTRCPLVVAGSIDGPVPIAVGMAIYQLVSDVAQVVPADSPLIVDLGGGRADRTRVTITASSVDLEVMRQQLVHSEDRFVAAGGQLTAIATAHGVVLEGAAPCES